MNKKYYHIIIIVLLLLNIFSWRFWWDSPQNNFLKGKDKIERKKSGVGIRFLVDKLNLDENQKRELEILVRVYFTEIKEINTQIRISRDKIAEELINNSNKNSDSILLELTHHKMNLERTTLEHFTAIRDLCNTDQKIAFDSLFVKMMHHFDGIPPRHRFNRGQENRK